MWNIALFASVVIYSDVLSQKVFHMELIKSLQHKFPNTYLRNISCGVSKSSCAATCTTSVGCMSFFYEKKNRGCILHGSDLSVMSGVILSRHGVQYYRKTGNIIGRSCSSTGDCTTPNAECRADGKCGCISGFSFDPRSTLCKTGCVQYGDTFGYFAKHAIWVNNVVTKDVSSVGECMSLCIDATTFTCVCFDIKLSTKTCYLHDVGPQGVPASDYRGDNNHDFFYRNCM